MRVHHLDCGSLCPVAGSLLNAHGRMVCHCLLVETERDGLVLVDTGMGLDDCARPAERMGAAFVKVAGWTPQPSQTAAMQVERLGFRREDVRHVVLTHLDLDHAGGLADFPGAQVHVHVSEHRAAVVTRALADRARYRACHWAHGPRFSLYEQLAGERWFGFERARPFEGLSAEIFALPLPGHTQGHAAIGVRTETGFLLHAGDAYFHEGTVDPSRERPRFGARTFERAVAWDYRLVERNHARLLQLAQEHGDVRVFCAHDPSEYQRVARA